MAEDAPVLAGIAAASVQGVAALGERAGARVRRLGDPIDEDDTSAPGRCHARQSGFDLHAGVFVPAGDRERLELRHSWSDGTTHLVFDPVELLERLAVLTPRPGGWRWADLMRRTFGFDVLACPHCGGRLRLIALIEQASVIERILRHLGLPTELPKPRPARAPPLPISTRARQCPCGRRGSPARGRQ